jgi:pimeloyl-ACP methyl ester carboxylesterase
MPMHCQLDDVTVYYEQAGAGHPLLFLHGWSLDHRYELIAYEPILEARGGWRRIYLDLPGMGRTPAPPWMTNLDQMLDIVLKFIDRVLPDQPFAIAGTSAGAYLARGVVYHKTASVDGVLLRVPLIIPDAARRTLPPVRTLIDDPSVVATLAPDEAAELAPLLVQTPEFVAQLRSKFRAAIRPAQQLANDELLGRIRGDPRAYTFSFDVDDPRLRCDAPSLFLLGRQDLAVGYQDAWAILERYPRASFVVLDRADHLLPVEQERVFGALVHDWLDRVEEYIESCKNREPRTENRSV